MALKVIAAATGAEIEIKQSSPKGFHPNRSGEIVFDGKVIGLVGELDPSLSKANDLPRTVGIFELDLDQLIALSPEVVKATQLGTLPAATQDLSLVVAQEIPAGEVLAAVREGAGELLEAISLTDDYRGENIPAGTKSLTFALRFRAMDRTLTQAEASEARDRGVALAHERFKAEIRT